MKFLRVYSLEIACNEKRIPTKRRLLRNGLSARNQVLKTMSLASAANTVVTLGVRKAKILNCKSLSPLFCVQSGILGVVNTCQLLMCWTNSIVNLSMSWLRSELTHMRGYLHWSAGLKFFQLNSYSLQAVFYFLYINMIISLGFLVSARFRNVKTATGELARSLLTSLPHQNYCNRHFVTLGFVLLL